MNGLSHESLSCPVNDVSNRAAYKTCFKTIDRDTKKHRLAKECAIANMTEQKGQKINKEEQKANIDARSFQKS